MLKRIYRDTNLNISVLGLGCMRLPKVSPEKADIDYDRAQEIVDYAYANGINYFDTAYMYHEGQSEKFIGQALKKYPRDSYYLATKMPLWFVNENRSIEDIFNEQLERCQTDHFDFYLIHAVNKERLNLYKEYNAHEFFLQKKREGKIRYLGFSFHDTPEVLEEACRTYTWDFAQIQLNYLDWEMQDAKKQYEILEAYQLPCIVMEPVRGGTLANPCEAANQLFKDYAPEKSIASWAIRYAASLPNVMTVLSGMSNMEQIQDNVKTMSDFKSLSESEYSIIEAAKEAYKMKDTVPCTGCRYCMDCPMGVDIPKMFTLYNQYAVNKDEKSYQSAYEETDASIRVEHCIACGACMSHCPQNIEIPKEMDKIHRLIEEKFKK